jgi:glycerol-3-phosphate dehydrogenase (NAD+)
MKRVVVIGNGNWGTTIAKLIAENVAESDIIENTVRMYVHEEEYNNRKLSEIINEDRINSKYLPDVLLPSNLLAFTNMDECSTADIFIFCIPHQYITSMKHIKRKEHSFGVNLCKGLIHENATLYAPSEYISKMLKMDVCSLMGANIANEVARQCLSDTTIGYQKEHQIPYLRAMFESCYFKPTYMPYNRGMEVSGAVKNIVGVAYGIICGLSDKYSQEATCGNSINASGNSISNIGVNGSAKDAFTFNIGTNTKAMVFRKGLMEIERACKVMQGQFYCLESACLGDLFVSCLSGRNFKCGYEIARYGSNVEEIESRMNGQRLQGPLTAKEMYHWLISSNCNMSDFPIIESVFNICFNNEAAESLYQRLQK